MARGQEVQRKRTQNDPLVLGTFDTTTLKYLKGQLGPLNQVVGSRDTSQQSNGGFGGGTYNHWFQITLKTEAWIIIAKAGLKPNYIQTSVYDMNRNPIEGRAIFQADSIATETESELFYTYFGHVMGAQSDLYNIFEPGRFDRGDERYYPLEAGRYLFCVSTTRNERLDYEIGLVIEFPATEIFFGLEDEVSFFLQEIQNEQSLIGTESDDNLNANSIHDHSLQEWRESWESTHQDTDKFPEVFIPLANRP